MKNAIFIDEKKIVRRNFMCEKNSLLFDKVFLFL